MKRSRCLHLLLALLIVAACASQTHGMNPEATLPDDGRLDPTNGNGTWSVMPSSTEAWLLSIWGSGPNDVFAVGAGATIIHYNGNKWSGMNSNTNGSINGVWGNSPTSVFATRYDPFDLEGQWGAVLNYDDVAWDEIITYGSSELHGIWGSSSDDILIVAAEGEAFHFDGLQWLYTNPGTSADLEAVWYSSPYNAFVVGSEGTILKYTGTWNSMGSGTTKWLFGVWGSSADNVFAVGEGGTILYYNGINWSSMSSGTGHWLYDVWGTSRDNVFAVGEGGTILHYDGTSWSIMASGTNASLEGVWGSSATDVFVVGSGGIILHYTEAATKPTVTTASVTGITTTAAQSGGEVTSDGGAAVTQRGVCWSTSDNPTISDDKTVDGSGTGIFESAITGLDPDSDYHVRAYATNSVGTAYGSDIAFTTLAEPTKPTVTTAAVTDITTTTARSGGEVTSDGGAGVSARGVCWSTSINPTISDDKTVNGSGTGIFESAITGLDPNTGYHVRAYATNEKGTAYGSDIAFTTPDAYTLYVSKDGTCGDNIPCYSTIQGAVDAADTGAVIKIAGGIYTESIILNRPISLTLQGGWDSSFASQTRNTILRQPPQAPQGSLILQMLNIIP